VSVEEAAKIVDELVEEGFRLICTNTDLVQLKELGCKLIGAGIQAMIVFTRELFHTHLVQQTIRWLGELPSRFRAKTLLNLNPSVQLDLIISRIVCDQLFAINENECVLYTERENLLDVIEDSDSDLWKLYECDSKRKKTRLNSLIVLNCKLFFKQRNLVLSFLNQAFTDFPEYKNDFIMHLALNISKTSFLVCNIDRMPLMQLNLYCNLFPVRYSVSNT
jgi:hypothetical protein